LSLDNDGVRRQLKALSGHRGRVARACDHQHMVPGSPTATTDPALPAGASIRPATGDAGTSARRPGTRPQACPASTGRDDRVQLGATASSRPLCHLVNSAKHALMASEAGRRTSSGPSGPAAAWPGPRRSSRFPLHRASKCKPCAERGQPLWMQPIQARRRLTEEPVVPRPAYGRAAVLPRSPWCPVQPMDVDNVTPASQGYLAAATRSPSW